MTYWYISFATDEGFRGATVVKARNAEGALAEATRRKLNPGGEAAILKVPKKAEVEPDMQAMINRLLGREEMLVQGGKRHGDCSEEFKEAFESAVDVVCADCNEPQ